MRKDAARCGSTILPCFLIQRRLFSFVSDFSSSPIAGSGTRMPAICFFPGGKSVILRKPILIFRPCCAWLFFIFLCSVSAARAQGPAPETAPPLFPGGGLISYNSIFTTRGSMPLTPSGIPATARPTFSHEGDINFTWGFYKDFDLTVILPIVTNHFSPAGAPASRRNRAGRSAGPGKVPLLSA